MNNLSGKTALATGASRGIGRATALVLARAGARIFFPYSCAEKDADAVAAEIRRPGGRAAKVNAVLALKDGPTGREIVLGMQALKRIVKPDDIAGVIAFLASDAARWITGHTVRVDGCSKM